MQFALLARPDLAGARQFPQHPLRDWHCCLLTCGFVSGSSLKLVIAAGFVLFKAGNKNQIGAWHCSCVAELQFYMQVTAAVVTCGGLCPGLNDVIQNIVFTLEDYGVPPDQIFGIKYGLRGFYDREAKPINLNKRIVQNIHLQGGTMLVSPLCLILCLLSALTLFVLADRCLLSRLSVSCFPVVWLSRSCSAIPSLQHTPKQSLKYTLCTEARMCVVCSEQRTSTHRPKTC